METSLSSTTGGNMRSHSSRRPGGKFNESVKIEGRGNVTIVRGDARLIDGNVNFALWVDDHDTTAQDSKKFQATSPLPVRDLDSLVGYNIRRTIAEPLQSMSIMGSSQEKVARIFTCIERERVQGEKFAQGAETFDLE